MNVLIPKSLHMKPENPVCLAQVASANSLSLSILVLLSYLESTRRKCKKIQIWNSEYFVLNNCSSVSIFVRTV